MWKCWRRWFQPSLNWMVDNMACYQHDPQDSFTRLTVFPATVELNETLVFPLYCLWDCLNVANVNGVVSFNSTAAGNTVVRLKYPGARAGNTQWYQSSSLDLAEIMVSQNPKSNFFKACWHSSEGSVGAPRDISRWTGGVGGACHEFSLPNCASKLRGLSSGRFWIFWKERFPRCACDRYLVRRHDGLQSYSKSTIQR